MRAIDAPGETGECVTAQYSSRPDGYIKVNNTQYFIDEQKFKNVEFVAKYAGQAKKDGHVLVNPTPLPGFWFNYDVLSTDYDNFAVVYGCTPYLFGWRKQESVWILTRRPLVIGSQPFNMLKQNVFRILKEKVPSYQTEEKMRPVIQGPKAETGCAYRL